jgi:hypothetical protein
MKTILLFLLAALFFKNTCQASIDTTIIEHFHKIIHLIETNNSTELSKLIHYPLKRSNPLPDIKNPTEFIAHYSSLFDISLKNLLKEYNDSDIFEHNGAYGLIGGNFSGQIWIGDDGKILGLVSSKTEEQEKQTLIVKIKREMNPSVNDWDENIVVGKSERLLIRVDNTNKGLRYICWNNGRTIKDIPNIILYNGIAEAQGEIGGWTWTFKNGDWTYVVDDAEDCEEIENCGLFLELLFKDQLKSKIKLTETK